MNDILYPLVALVAWAGMANQLRKLQKARQGRPATDTSRPATIGLIVAFGGLGLTFTICIPLIFKAVDAAFGIANITILISQISVLVYTAGQEVMLVNMAHSPEQARRRTWRRLATLAAIVPVMAVLFIVADADEQRTRDFVATYAGIKAYSVYLAFYLAAFGLGQIDVLRMALTLAVRPIRPGSQQAVYARIRSNASLRRGLRTVAVGSCFGLAYVAARTADIIAAQLDLGVDPHRWEFVAQLGSGVGAMLVIIGLSMPSWTSGIAALYRQVRQRRQYNRLFDLWNLMVQTVPQVALHGPADRLDRFSFGELSYRLQRRVTEICDGMRILAAFMSDAVAVQARQAAAAAGITDRAAADIALAAQLRHAAACYSEQEQGTALRSDGTLSAGRSNRAVAADAARLADVSKALRSPIVSRVTNQYALDAR